MDGELFGRLYHLAGRVASRTAGRRRTYSDFEVLVTFVLAAAAHRPLSWACRRSNWPLWCRRLVPRVPTPSTMSRRTRTRDFRRLLVRLDAALLADLPGSPLKFLDGKRGRIRRLPGDALLVGGHSRDRDARRGRAPGGWGDGYKFHAVVDACGGVRAFAVTPLDAGEATVARKLLTPACDLRGCLPLADANFDSNPLYADVAAAGGRLLAPRRKPGTGLGHGRRRHPDRLRAIEELEKTPGAQGLRPAAPRRGAGLRPDGAARAGSPVPAALGAAAEARPPVGDGQGHRLPRPPPPAGRPARGVDAEGYRGRGQG